MSKFNSKSSIFEIESLNTPYAVADDGTVLTTESTEAGEATADDMTLLPATPAVNDAYYFGGDGVFQAVLLKIGTQGVGTWTITWEYWDGDSWEALTVSDASVGFTAAAGEHLITFAEETDWATTAVNSITKYWIRGRVSAYNAVTTQPLGTQAWLVQDISKWMTEISGLPGERELNDVTALGDDGRMRYPSVENAVFRISGWWDDTTYSGVDAVLGPLLTTSGSVKFFFGPKGEGSAAIQYKGDARVRRYETGARVGDMVSWSAELEVDGQVTRGTYT